MNLIRVRDHMEVKTRNSAIERAVMQSSHLAKGEKKVTERNREAETNLKLKIP